MAARVRLEPDLAGEAAGGWFGLDPLGDDGGATAGAEGGFEIVEEINQDEAANRRGAPQQRLLQRVSRGGTHRRVTPKTGASTRGSAAQSEEIAGKFIGAQAA